MKVVVLVTCLFVYASSQYAYDYYDSEDIARITTAKDCLFAEEYLIRYGFLRENVTQKNKTEDYDDHTFYYFFFEDEERNHALKTFQKRYFLRITGTLTSETLAVMHHWRCGNQDISQGVEYRFSIGSSEGWKSEDQQKRNMLTFRFSKLSRNSKISSWEQKHQVLRAFAMWKNSGADIDFRPAKPGERADINIRWETGEHGDQGKRAFDGRGGILAHAFYPCLGNHLCGNLHLDDDEVWTGDRRNRRYATSLLPVATHEIGHALGLNHSEIRGSIMWPMYDRSAYYGTELHDDDKKGISDERLYRTKKSMLNVCESSMENLAYGLEIMGDKSTILFGKTNTLIKLYYNTPASGYPKLIQDDFPEFEGMVSAVLSIHSWSLTYLFTQNGYYWKYDTLKKPYGLIGKHKPISNWNLNSAATVHSAFHFMDEVIFITEEKGEKKIENRNFKHPGIQISNDIKRLKQVLFQLDRSYTIVSSFNTYSFQKNGMKEYIIALTKAGFYCKIIKGRSDFSTSCSTNWNSHFLGCSTPNSCRKNREKYMRLKRPRGMKRMAREFCNANAKHREIQFVFPSCQVVDAFFMLFKDRTKNKWYWYLFQRKGFLGNWVVGPEDVKKLLNLQDASYDWKEVQGVVPFCDLNKLLVFVKGSILVFSISTSMRRENFHFQSKEPMSNDLEITTAFRDTNLGTVLLTRDSAFDYDPVWSDLSSSKIRPRTKLPASVFAIAAAVFFKDQLVFFDKNGVSCFFDGFEGLRVNVKVCFRSFAQTWAGCC